MMVNNVRGVLMILAWMTVIQESIVEWDTCEMKRRLRKFDPNLAADMSTL